MQFAARVQESQEGGERRCETLWQPSSLKRSWEFCDEFQSNASFTVAAVPTSVPLAAQAPSLENKHLLISCKIALST
jgi:hypothetical protein